MSEQVEPGELVRRAAELFDEDVASGHVVVMPDSRAAGSLFALLEQAARLLPSSP